jgi:uncharacterized tellurite resistance protein B-like protein
LGLLLGLIVIAGAQAGVVSHFRPPPAGAGCADTWETIMAWDFFKTLVSRGAWSKEDAFYGLLLAAASADGEVTASESEEVIALAHRTKTLKGVSTADLQVIHNRVEDQFKRDFAAALNDACNSIPTEVVGSIFAHAVDIVFADGKVVTKEVEFLRSLAEKLKLEEAKAQQIIDVLKTKNEF